MNQNIDNYAFTKCCKCGYPLQDNINNAPCIVCGNLPGPGIPLENMRLHGIGKFHKLMAILLLIILIIVAFLMVWIFLF